MRIMPMNFRRIFLLAVLALLLACSETKRYQPLPPGTVVLALGDSVTYGTGARNGEQDFPTLLSQRSGWKVVNAGIPGDVSANGRTRVDQLLRDTGAVLVIVELGGNDLLRRVPEREVKENLRAILQSVKKSGAIPVLVAVPEFSIVLIGSLSDSSMYAELAKEEGVVLVEGVFSKVLSDATLRADRIHPNADGYREMADGIAKTLVKVGLLKEK